ncbi:MAG: DUF6112 family protein [Actinomycetota bacterium]|nr:DUF6112 family protein [Actinomycetota bacterium]
MPSASMMVPARLALADLALLIAQFNVQPDSDAPGARGLQEAINVFAYYALLAAAGGFLIGAAAWAVGGRIGNDYTATAGKIGMFTALGVAFLVGAASVLLNFAYDAGRS